MSIKPKVEIHIVNGRLLTNRPEVFAKNFEFPETAPVDGLTRVSPEAEIEFWDLALRDMSMEDLIDPDEMTADDWTDAVEDWLGGDADGN